VAEATPMALGMDRPLPTAKLIFFKKFCLALGGGPATPRAISKTKTKTKKLFFIFLNIKKYYFIIFFIFKNIK
jgi:hypothetical protein